MQCLPSSWWDQPGWSPTQACSYSLATCSCAQRPLRADPGPLPCTVLGPPSEGQARPVFTAADPKNKGNKDRGETKRTRHDGAQCMWDMLIPSVSTVGGPPKHSPSCCQDHTSVATFPPKLPISQGRCLYSPLLPCPTSFPYA